MADEILNIQTPKPEPEEVPRRSTFDDELGKNLPRVRTYAADMSEVIKKRGETLASIVNKEKTSTTQDTSIRREVSWSPRTITLVAGTALLVLAGIGALIAVFVFSPQNAATVENTGGIIFANKTERLAVSDSDDLIKRLAETRANESLSLGEVSRIVVVKDGVGPLSPGELAARLGFPPALTREVTDIMIGVHSFDRNQPFIILKVSAYDRTFGAMLVFEHDMGRTLGGFFAPVGSTGNVPPLSFVDDVIRNLDVRRSDDSWPVLYTFPSQNMLIITTNEFTLREIMTRLGAFDQSF